MRNNRSEGRKGDRHSRRRRWMWALAPSILFVASCSGSDGDAQPAVVVEEADGTGRPTVAEADAMVRDFKSCFEEAGVPAEIYNEDEGDFREDPGQEEEGDKVSIIYSAEAGVEVDVGRLRLDYPGDFVELEDRCLLIVAEISPSLNVSPEELAEREEVMLNRLKCYNEKGFVATTDGKGGLFIDQNQPGYDEEAYRAAADECRQAFPDED